MFSNFGKCTCGQTKVKISLPETLDKFSPRACDCDFCVSRNISYLSHPEGELEIESAFPLKILKQGSNQASFITCSSCKSVIASSLQLEDKLVGALNSPLLSDFSLLQNPTIVSPKKLKAQEKVERWQKLWLNIKVNGVGRI
ncbi:hypothetical protein ACLKMH_12110 [Psychromonas sp. KJ10-10]|uniref:hypothetical protein n=1 Tax=Psychromonas sp. KJ10-10 TaxID=3391823 RepID=UPI0039B4D2AA